VFMVLGPDGAIYVADFYNRIIGHYEVPLSHPGRDRTRGRIWRIVYHHALSPLGKGGSDGGLPTPAPQHLTGSNQPSPLSSKQVSFEQLIKDLDHPNLTVRMLA